jgi:dUTP pyrophosphatase
MDLSVVQAVRQLYENDGRLEFDNAFNEPCIHLCNLSSDSWDLVMQHFSVFVPTFSSSNSESLVVHGPDVLIFLRFIYPTSDPRSDKEWKTFWDLCSQKATSKMLVTRTSSDAILPRKTIESDAGFDLVLISLVSKPASTAQNGVYMYDTGVVVCPPPGYYFDLVPRSSMIKSGYILANSVGVIDPSYRGSIKVPLIKIDPNAPDLQLPQRLVQLIPRKAHYMYVEECASDLTLVCSTMRGTGGFGSTG